MLQRLFQRLADSQRPQSGVDSGLQTLLSTVAPFYGGGSWLNRFSYESGLRARHRLPVPVISVGNVTLGGTGKSPFCIWLIEHLKRMGRRPAVIARGYGREDEDRLVVVHDGKRLLANTRTAGDEPVMLATALKDVPVIACADRFRGGKVAVRKFGADVIVLDDGFQHHRLERQCDIVLVDATRRLSSLRVFPRGTLREPASVLNRAHLVVLTRWNQARQPDAVLREVRALAPNVPVMRTAVGAQGLMPCEATFLLDPSVVRGRRAVVFCAVGNPQSVRQSVVDLGLRPVAFRALPDHTRVNVEFIERLEELRRAKEADFLVVTEKDAVKIREAGDCPRSLHVLRARLQPIGRREQKAALTVVKSRLHAGRVRGLIR